MEKLTSLNIEGIPIGMEGYKSLCEMKQLKSLRIAFKSEKLHDRHHVTRLISSLLPNLACLELRYCNLIAQDAEYFYQLINLKSLDVSYGYLGDEGMIHISKLRNLTNLNISRNAITPKGASYFKELKQLTNLNLHGCGIGSSGFKALCITELCNLTMLDIGANNIGSTEIRSICKMNQLTFLDISCNLIFIESCDLIKTNLTNLRHIVLDEKTLDPEIISQVNLPKLSVSIVH